MSMLKALFWNPEQRRLRALWRLLILGVLFFVGSIVAALPIFVLAMLFPLLIGEQGVLLRGLEETILSLVMVASLPVTLVSVWVVGRFLDRRRFVDFGFRFDRKWWLDLGFGLALGAALMALVFVVEWAAGWVTVTGTFYSAPGAPFLLLILFHLAGYLSVGIYEELLSRGYILRNLAEGFNWERWGPRAAVVLAWLVSSALFGLAHAGNPNASLVSTVNLIVAGVFLGVGYVLTGELAIPIGLHVTWNLFQGNVFGFPVSGMATRATFIAIEQGGPDLWTGGAFGPEAGLIGLAAMALGSVLIVAWVRLWRGRVALRGDLAQYDPTDAPGALIAKTAESDGREGHL